MLSAPRLSIDLEALLHNYIFLKSRLANSVITPVVKADAYGLGAQHLAPALWMAGARCYYVACLDEGLKLRKVLPAVAEIRILHGVLPGTAATLRQNDLRPVINSVEQLTDWSRETGLKDPVVLHVDTGMNRLGLPPEHIADLASAWPGLHVDMLMSHLACADVPDHPMNARQLEAFLALKPLFPRARTSFANSAGIFLGPDFQGDEVRPGISLLGGGPTGIPHPELKQVASLHAPVIQVRTLKPGQSIGYGATYLATKEHEVAILHLGYADGIMRRFEAMGTVRLREADCRCLGRISMDLMAVDVSGLGVQPGDAAQILGPQRPVDVIANWCDTHAHDVLTRLGGRADRHIIPAREPAANLGKNPASL
jgi:alanine racemase